MLSSLRCKGKLIVTRLIFCSNCPSWYVGEIIAYMMHEPQGVERFLALVSVVEDSAMDRFGVPIVKLFAEDARKKMMVCEAEHIMFIVDLVRYNENDLKYKLIWPDSMYHKMLDEIPRGQRRDM